MLCVKKWTHFCSITNAFLAFSTGSSLSTIKPFSCFGINNVYLKCHHDDLEISKIGGEFSELQVRFLQHTFSCLRLHMKLRIFLKSVSLNVCIQNIPLTHISFIMTTAPYINVYITILFIFPLFWVARWRSG